MRRPNRPNRPNRSKRPSCPTWPLRWPASRPRLSPGPLRVALLVAALAALPGCEPAPTDSTFPDQVFDAGATADGGGESSDGATTGGDPFVGTWGLATDWSTCVTVGSRIETRSRKILRVEVTRKGNRLLEQRQLCQIQLTPIFGLKTVVPQVVVDAMGTWQVESRLLGEGGEEIAYAGGLEGQLMGLQMANPIYDVMPLKTEPSDPRLIDPENDGNPGATFNVGPSCKLYVAQRETSNLTGRVVGPGRIEGGGAHATEQVVFGSSAAICGQTFATFSNTPHHKFLMLKAAGKGWDDDKDGTVSCAEIVKHHTEWMTWAEPDDKRCPEKP